MCRNIFRSASLNGGGSNNLVIVLKDVAALDLEHLLDFMYVGVVDVDKACLPSLIKTAENLQIKGLAFPDQLTETNASDSLTPTAPQHQQQHHIEQHQHQHQQLVHTSAQAMPRELVQQEQDQQLLQPPTPIASSHFLHHRDAPPLPPATSMPADDDEHHQQYTPVKCVATPYTDTTGSDVRLSTPSKVTFENSKPPTAAGDTLSPPSKRKRLLQDYNNSQASNITGQCNSPIQFNQQQQYMYSGTNKKVSSPNCQQLLVPSSAAAAVAATSAGGGNTQCLVSGVGHHTIHPSSPIVHSCTGTVPASSIGEGSSSSSSSRECSAASAALPVIRVPHLPLPAPASGGMSKRDNHMQQQHRPPPPHMDTSSERVEDMEIKQELQDTSEEGHHAMSPAAKEAPELKEEPPADDHDHTAAPVQHLVRGSELTNIISRQLFVLPYISQ